MGTNYYWIITNGRTPLGHDADDADDDAPIVHIGKRGAAGLYCWDCNQTLCKDGEAGIHSGPRHIKHDEKGFVDFDDYRRQDDRRWNTACPMCGKTRQESEPTAAYMELGFTKPRGERPTGVQSCSSFSWAQNPEVAGTRLREGADQVLVRDEYDRELTGEAFLDMLRNNCPVQFTHSVGVHFS